jgi:hypothetical protein
VKTSIVLSSLLLALAAGCGGAAADGDVETPDARADAANDAEALIEDAADAADAAETIDAANPALCDYPATCPAGARYLAALSGDEAPKGNEVTTDGYSSEWLLLDVNETNKSPLSSPPLMLEVTLTNPPGEDFDLYVYVPDASGKTECTAVTAKSTNAGDQPEEVRTQWADSWSDDSRKVTIEVRHVANGCSKNAKWTLYVRGGPTS